MARKRMIDPSLWSDDGMAELPPRQQLLYIGLFSNADDHGRLKGSPVAIRLALPGVYGGCALDDIALDLDDVLSRMSKLRRYSVDGRDYLQFDNYATWQRIDKPSDSILPPPACHSENDQGTVADHSPNDPVAVADHSPLIEEKRREEKGVEARDGDGSANESEPFELSPHERRVIGIVKQTRGMASVPDEAVALHLREVLGARASPLPDETIVAETMKWRDHHTERLADRPQNERFRGWKNAITNWFSRPITVHKPLVPGDAVAPEAMRVPHYYRPFDDD